MIGTEFEFNGNIYVVKKLANSIDKDYWAVTLKGNTKIKGFFFTSEIELLLNE